MRAKAPQRLLIAPQDIRTVDPTIASEIQDGYFAFGGKIVNAGALSPFEIEAPSKSWARALGGFGWLKHLRAADAQTSRANARALVADFLKLRGRPAADDPMWEPRVVSRRILAFLSQSPMLLQDAEPDFYRRFMHHFAARGRSSCARSPKKRKANGASSRRSRSPSSRFAAMPISARSARRHSFSRANSRAN